MESLTPGSISSRDGGGTESPSRRSSPRQYLQDSDSCPSISPSPDPDSIQKTFDFSNVDTINMSEFPDLSAALQTEREFIDFMFSLPQIQKEAIEKGHGRNVDKSGTDNSEEENSQKRNPQNLKAIPIPKVEKKGPIKCSTASPRGGLEHLDNLCKMMDQLTDLREQNSKLQRRVQYLEDLKTIQDLHRELQGPIVSKPLSLRLTPLSLSDSEIRLDELTDVPISGATSEDSLIAPPLVARINKQHQKGKYRINKEFLFLFTEKIAIFVYRLESIT